MNEQELQAIEERANAATPGPWTVDDHPNDFAVIAPHPVESGNTYIAFIDGGLSNDSRRDGAFIAHARADVPALIAEVRSLRAKLDAVHEYAAYYNDVSNQGDAPETFANWYNGAAQQEAQP
jgi:hypothetical protein